MVPARSIMLLLRGKSAYSVCVRSDCPALREVTVPKRRHPVRRLTGLPISPHHKEQLTMPKLPDPLVEACATARLMEARASAIAGFARSISEMPDTTAVKPEE